MCCVLYDGASGGGAVVGCNDGGSGDGVENETNRKSNAKLSSKGSS